MRKRTTRQGLTVQAIAGTFVVLLGFNMEQTDCDGLMGFAIHRKYYQLLISFNRIRDIFGNLPNIFFAK